MGFNLEISGTYVTRRAFSSLNGFLNWRSKQVASKWFSVDFLFQRCMNLDTQKWMNSNTQKWISPYIVVSSWSQNKDISVTMWFDDSTRFNSEAETHWILWNLIIHWAFWESLGCYYLHAKATFTGEFSLKCLEN